MLPLSSSSYNPLISTAIEAVPDVETQAWALVAKGLLSRGKSIEDVDKTQFSPLRAAVNMNDLELCKEILALGWPINPLNEKFELSALNEAIYFGFNELAIYLIENGADISLKAQNGMSYLHLAVVQENPIVAETLIKANPSLLEALVDNPNFSWSKFSGEPSQPLDTISRTPLSLAMMLPNGKQGQNTAVFLIKQGASIAGSSPAGYTYLHLAAARGYDEVCKLLIGQGMDVNVVCTLRSSVFCYQFTPLFYAVTNKQVKNTKLLLDHNASYKKGRVIQESSFGQALLSGNEELIRLFLDRGEELDQEEEGTPLLVAALLAVKEEGRRPLFELFLKLGMKPEQRFSDQRTYLHAAVRNNQEWLCELFLKQGTDINAVDANQMNALHHAANLDHRDLISFLLCNGADARALDSKAHTPLIYLEANKATSSDECIDLKNADQGFSSWLRKLRMVGLRNSLSGEIFEGSDRFLPYLQLAESLQSYLGKNPTLPAFLHSFPEMIKQSPYLSCEQVMSKLDQGEIVTLSSGWSRHETSIVISKEFLIVGNRGDHCGDKPGMKIYAIKNPSLLAEAIQALIDNRDFVINGLLALLQTHYKDNTNTVSQQAEKMSAEAKEKHIKFFNKKLVELLDLEQIHYIPQKGQVSGNCTWLGAKMALKGSLILHHLQQDPEVDIKELLPQIKKITSGWSKYDLVQSLPVLKEAESVPELKRFIDFEAIYEELFALNFFNEEASNKLIQYHPRLEELKSNPNSNSFLYAFKHQKPKLMKLLLEKGVEPKISKFSNSTRTQIDAILLEYFIKGGVKSNFSDIKGETPLDFFCSKTDKTRPLKLLKAWKEECESTNNREQLKTIINSVDELGFTPLMTLLLCSVDLKSSKELIELLLQCGADVSHKNHKGGLLLHYALKKVKTLDDVEILTLLLAASPNPGQMLNTKNSYGNDSLDIALNCGNEILTKLLLDHGAKVKEQHINELSNPNMDKNLFEYFLKKGFKLNLRDSEGLNALHILCLNDNTDFALKLLKAWRGQCESIDDRNDLKKIINTPQPSGGATPLIFLISSSDDLEPVSELISLMIQCGADVSATQKQKQNALHYAVSKIKRSSDLNIIKILLENSKEASIALNSPSIYFATPMHIIPPDAEWSAPLAKMFMDHGAL